MCNCWPPCNIEEELLQPNCKIAPVPRRRGRFPRWGSIAISPSPLERDLERLRVLACAEWRGALAGQRPALLVLARKRNDWTSDHEQLEQLVVEGGRRPEIAIGEGMRRQVRQVCNRQVRINPSFAGPFGQGHGRRNALVIGSSVDESDSGPILRSETNEPTA